MGKGVIDYAFKSYVMNNHQDLLQKAKKSKRFDYAIHQYNETGVLMPILERSNEDYKSVNDLLLECCESGLNREILECFKINEASWKRTQRLRHRIEEMLTSGQCLFLTLTFSDETLATTDEKQRRVAVSRYLKQYQSKYVANIDYGSKNHREHYHAVIQCSKVNSNTWKKYGSIDFERIRIKNINCDRYKLAKYICKLSNHAIKETTKRSSLLYSR